MPRTPFVCVFLVNKIVQQASIDESWWEPLCDAFNENSGDVFKGLTVSNLQLIFISQSVDVVAIVQNLKKTKSITRSKIVRVGSKEWEERAKKLTRKFED